MQDKQDILSALSTFISIPSVSTDPKHGRDMKRAVDFLSQTLKPLGFKVQILKKQTGQPFIYASRIIASKAKTIGIYGHYDVQPEDPVNEWASGPFKLTLRNGAFYGRGVADNKGHIIQNVYSINRLIKKNKLSNNIVFVLEGEEESGSGHFEEYVGGVKKELDRVDVFFVTDMGMHNKNVPQIFYALRGLIYFEIEVTIGSRDLHSGVYGNRVLNPIQILSELFSKIKNSATGQILIPHFYDEVRTPTKKEYELLKKTARTNQEEQKQAGTYAVSSINKLYPYLSAKIYPSFDPHGIVGGYIGEGSKTVIPRLASAKFSFRLVENQSPVKIEKIVRKFIAESLPKGARYKLLTLSSDSPFYTSVDNEFVRKTAASLEDVFLNKALINRSGGSVPAAEILSRLFKKPVILTGFTLPSDNIHAPNENFDEDMFFKGIIALEKLYG